MDHARRDGADRARRDGNRRGNGQQPRGRGLRGPGWCDCGPVGFRSRAGVNALGVSLGGSRVHGAILRGKMRVLGVRVHRAPLVRTFGLPPPAHPVVSGRRGARAPRGRASCRHNSTSQPRPSCVLVRDLRPWAFEIPQATEGIRMRLFRGVLAWHTALASSRQSALCVVFDLHATVTTKNTISGQNLAIRAAPHVSQIPHRARKGGHEPSPRSYTTKAPLACAR